MLMKIFAGFAWVILSTMLFFLFSVTLLFSGANLDIVTGLMAFMLGSASGYFSNHAIKQIDTDKVYKKYFEEEKPEEAIEKYRRWKSGNI